MVDTTAPGGAKRGRRGAVIVLLAVGMTALSTATFASPNADPSDSYIGDVVSRFMSENDIDPLRRPAESTTPVNPFGGDVGLDPSATDIVMIESTGEAVLNFGPAAWQGRDPGPVSITRINGEVDVLAEGVPLDYLPPSIPGSPIEGPGGLLSQAGLDPFAGGIQMLDGRDVVIAGPADPAVRYNTVTVRTVRLSSGALPLGPDCGGNIIEIGSVDALTDAPRWPADFAPNDSFKDGSLAHVTRCQPGVGWETERFVNQGSSFASLGTDMTSVVTADGIVSFIPDIEIPGSEGHRFFAFITPAGNPYQSNTVAFFSEPAFPALTTPGTPPAIVFPSFPGQELNGPFPFFAEFNGVWEAPEDGSSGCNYYPSQYNTLYEGYTTPDGEVWVNDLVSGQLMTGSGVNEGGMLTLDVAGSGDVYDESLMVTGGTGTYLHSDEHGDCPYDTTITNFFEPENFIAIVEEPAVVDEPDEEPASVDEPDEQPDEQPASVDEPDEQPASVDEPDEQPDEQPASVDEPDEQPDDGSGGSTGAILLVLGGVGLAAGGGVLLARKRKSDDDTGTAVVTEDPDPLPGLDDEPVAVAEPAPEPPAHRVMEDSYIRVLSQEDAEWDLNEADRARWYELNNAQVLTTWTTAQATETRVQAEIKAMIDESMAELKAGVSGLATAIGDYSGSSRTLLTESEPILQLWNEWSREGGVKDIAWWADLAEAFTGVGLLGTRLLVGGHKLVVRVAGATDEVADALKVTDEVADGARGADEAFEAAKAEHIAKADAAIARSEQELYEWVEQLERFTGIAIDDYSNGLKLREALVEAARLQGYATDLFFDVERIALQRIIAKLQMLNRGSDVAFDAKDLAWLHRRGSEPGFWDALSKAAGLDLDGRVYKLVSDLELGWLKNLANSPDAARAANAQRAANAAGNVPASLPTTAPPVVRPPAGPGVTVPPPGATVPPPNVTLPPPGATVPPPGWTGAPTLQGAGLNPTGLGGMSTSAPTLTGDLMDTVRLGADHTPTLTGDLMDTVRLGADHTPTLTGDLMDTVRFGADEAPTLLEGLAKTIIGGTP